MEYLAVFEIDCGVSHGFGLKSPDHEKRTEKISADNPQDAYKNAMDVAEKFADDYLSNPSTGLTVVNLQSLIGPDGAVSFDAAKSAVERSTLDHFIAGLLASHPDSKRKTNPEMN